MKISINQPYYYPYAGWFRLFAASDLFVILDDVQFNRRGRVHRYDCDDRKWTTLPIKKTDRDTTRIMDLEWQKGQEKPVPPIDYIVSSMEDMCGKLNIRFNSVRSSTMSIQEDLHGQDRIISICEKLGATKYINSPGGKNIYDSETFNKHGIELEFLPAYKGSNASIIKRLAIEKPEKIRKEIYDNL